MIDDVWRNWEPCFFFHVYFRIAKAPDHFSDPVFIISLHGSTKWNTCYLLQYAYHIHYDWSLFLECLFPPFDPPISLSINPIIFILHDCSSSKHYHQPYHSYKNKQAVAKQKTKWLWNPKPKTGWWFQNCFIFASFWGKMNPFWLIFFRWVGSTTNQKPPKTLFAVPVCRGNLRNLVVCHLPNSRCGGVTGPLVTWSSCGRQQRKGTVPRPPGKSLIPVDPGAGIP